jgi:hypothetical protein
MSPPTIHMVIFATVPHLQIKPSSIQHSSHHSLSYLLNSTVPLIANANNISDGDPIPTDTVITVLVNCVCFGHNYQHNSWYILKTEDENYFTLANNTYEALTTCQAIDAQNIYGFTNLASRLNLHVPLRCAWSISKQMENGFKHLLTYLISEGEWISWTYCWAFGVDSV